ncbi:MAG: pyrroline-5-carboxylate reductase [Burkholderiaceae bacterium]
MKRIVFVGGGNMASAVISGLLKQGHAAHALHVVDPGELQREKLRGEFGVSSQAVADSAVTGADLVVWAVKPQTFVQAALECAPWVGAALHLSVMAGIRIAAISQALRSERVVRAMPNTPALIGQGISGMFAPPAVSAAERSFTEQVLRATGSTLWVDTEADLDAVTALSGSGPAYVFYFLEAMLQAAAEMGLSPEVGRRLALATFSGATALSQASPEAPATLRERVTSKGGTTHAALSCLETHGVKAAFVEALHAARRRAGELGDQFGHASPPV